MVLLIVYYSRLAVTPECRDFIEVSRSDYGYWSKQPGVRFDDDGKIVAYKPVWSLKETAEIALALIRSGSIMILAMGEAFGEKIKTCVTSLKEIINGNDVTEGTMPEKLNNLTD
ncbi:hypothetical protein PT277_02165 [Acetobacteraceae bacterium ESL0709]|nr:hypothetical protein [Acetobacteraceae bacterium ESL0697]MDF7677507.1 hypothetical protein [Acetobacteraceae bacterium ESL0709]